MPEKRYWLDDLEDLAEEVESRWPPTDRPELRLMPTGDDAPPSSDPLLDRLVASVDAIAGPRQRPKLTAVRGGRDDA